MSNESETHVGKKRKSIDKTNSKAPRRPFAQLEFSKVENKSCSKQILDDDSDNDLFQVSQSATSESHSSQSSLRSHSLDLPIGRHSEMWITKYHPKHLSELVVQKAKLKEIRQWIEQSLSAQKPKLLIVAGPPGIGKSTAIRLLAQDMRIQLLEWIDSTSLGMSFHDKEYFSSRMQNGSISKKRSEFTRFQSRLNEFHDFLMQSARFGKRCLATQSVDQYKNYNNSVHTIIFLDDLPVVTSKKQREEFDQIICEFIARSNVPCIIVFSNVPEKSETRSSIQRFLPSSLHHHNRIDQIAISPVTQAAVKKRLDYICRAERLYVRKEKIDAIIQDAGGDIRSAINSLQFFCGTASKIPSFPSNSEESHSSSKDAFVSKLHAVARLLWAKTETSTRKTSNGDKSFTKLAFNAEFATVATELVPEELVESLAENGLDYFSNIDYISHAWESLSDTLYLSQHQSHLRRLHENWMDQSENLSDSIAHSSLARIMAVHNLTPINPGFKAQRNPFECQKKAVHSKRLLLEYFPDLCVRLNQQALCTETLPFVSKFTNLPLPDWAKSYPTAIRSLSLLNCLQDSQTNSSVVGDFVPNGGLSDDDIENT